MLIGQDGVGDAKREILVAVEADLRFRPDLVDQSPNPVLGFAEHQRTGRVDHIHALRAGIHHGSWPA